MSTSKEHFESFIEKFQWYKNERDEKMRTLESLWLSGTVLDDAKKQIVDIYSQKAKDLRENSEYISAQKSYLNMKRAERKLNESKKVANLLQQQLKEAECIVVENQKGYESAIQEYEKKIVDNFDEERKKEEIKNKMLNTLSVVVKKALNSDWCFKTPFTKDSMFASIFWRSQSKKIQNLSFLDFPGREDFSEPNNKVIKYKLSDGTEWTFELNFEERQNDWQLEVEENHSNWECVEEKEEIKLTPWDLFEYLKDYLCNSLWDELTLEEFKQKMIDLRDEDSYNKFIESIKDMRTNVASLRGLPNNFEELKSYLAPISLTDEMLANLLLWNYAKSDDTEKKLYLFRWIDKFKWDENLQNLYQIYDRLTEIWMRIRETNILNNQSNYNRENNNSQHDRELNDNEEKIKNLKKQIANVEKNIIELAYPYLKDYYMVKYNRILENDEHENV